MSSKYDKKLEKMYEDICHDLEGEYSDFEFVKKQVHTYFLDRKIHKLIGEDFADEDDYIYFRKFPGISEFGGFEIYFDPNEPPFYCDRIGFFDEEDIPRLVDQEFTYEPPKTLNFKCVDKISFRNKIPDIKDSEFQKGQLNQIKLIFTAIRRITKTDYWYYMQKLHPVYLGLKISERKNLVKNKKMREVFDEWAYGKTSGTDHSLPEQKEKSSSAKIMEDKRKNIPNFKEVENLKVRLKNKIGDDLKTVINYALTQALNNKEFKILKKKNRSSPGKYSIPLPDNYLSEISEIDSEEVDKFEKNYIEQLKRSTNMGILLANIKENDKVEIIITI